MFIRFLVGNYKSFDEIQEFSLIGGRTRSKQDHYLENEKHLKLLRIGAVFGANASGKSNIISAINFAQAIILHNTETMEHDVYYKLKDKNKEKPSYFEFEIKIDETYYTYGFEVIIYKKEFVSEWLYEISPYAEKLIFDRDLKNGRFETGFKNLSKEIKQKLAVYIDDIKNNPKILFLNEMNRYKKGLYQDDSDINIIHDVYTWFKKTLEVNLPDEPITDYSYFQTDNKEEVLEIIRSFGTGISDFKMMESTLEDIMDDLPQKIVSRIRKDINEFILYKDKNKSQVITNAITIRGKESIYLIFFDEENEISVNTIVFEHEVKNKLFKLSEESDGTKRLLDLIEVLIPSENEKVYVIDELDRSLHPQLTYKFVELFLKICANDKKQLILTTHESRLLDFNLLRRDEIWFVEKKKGSSELFSLEAFNERFDRKIDKAYLDGRYGGVPIFTAVYPVKESQ